IQIAHVGKYLEAKTYSDMGEKEKASELYKKLIEYYRRAVIKDPSDLSAVSYRVQCYIDLGEYSEARNYCHSLSESVRKPLLEQISRAESAEKES
ncbi:MAG: tetratricopeptide repeat protein, partial [Ruminococcus sp.]